MNIAGDNLALEILIWIVVAFFAGLIGYFGRHLGIFIIDKLRRRKPPPDITAELARNTSANQESTLEETRLKIEKKRAKIEAKKAKKAQKK